AGAARHRPRAWPPPAGAGPPRGAAVRTWRPPARGAWPRRPGCRRTTGRPGVDVAHGASAARPAQARPAAVRPARPTSPVPAATTAARPVHARRAMATATDSCRRLDTRLWDQPRLAGRIGGKPDDAHAARAQSRRGTLGRARERVAPAAALHLAAK